MIVLQGHRERVEQVAFSLNGESLLAPTWQGIQVWRQFLSGGVPTVLPVRHTRDLHFAPNGAGVFALGYGLYHADLGTGNVTELIQGGTVSRFALAHKGDWYIMDRLRIGGDGPVMVARGATEDELWTKHSPAWWGQPLFLPGDQEFIIIEVGRDSRNKLQFRVVTLASRNGDEIRRSNPLADEVREWVLSPDGIRVACCYTVWIHVYPLHQPFDKPLATVRNDNRREFTGIAFHPSGRFLAATSNDATVKLYDTTTWEVARTFTWDIGRMRSVAFSPDGTLAAAGSDKGKVVVWDVDL